MISEFVLFSGAFTIGNTCIVSLPPVELRRLADLLKANVAEGRDTLIQIGDDKMRFTYGSELGDAIIDEAGVLVFRSNGVDLLTIAEGLADMAERDVEIDMDHIHLEPIYLSPTGDVKDIVIERIGQ